MDDRTDASAEPARGSGAAHLRAAAAAPDAPIGSGPGGPDERAPARGWRVVVTRVKALLTWWQHSRAGRANARFGAAGGGLLTGGIAYASLFAVFSGLTLGYTVFMLVLGSNQHLKDTVLRTVASSLPGLVDTGDGEGLIRPDQLRMSAGLSVAGVVAVVALVLSALSAVAALQTALRAMWGDRQQGSAVTIKLRELGGFAAMGLAVLLSAVLGLALTSVADWLLGAVGWDAAARFAGRALGILITFVVDAVTFVVMVRVLAGQRPPRKDLVGGAVIAAVGLGVVRVLGTSVVSGSVRSNPVLASFAVIVVLLLWINLVARIVLLAAAWTANPPLAEATRQTGAQPEPRTGPPSGTKTEPTAAPAGARVGSGG